MCEVMAAGAVRARPRKIEPTSLAVMGLNSKFSTRDRKITRSRSCGPPALNRTHGHLWYKVFSFILEIPYFLVYSDLI